mmetsp:Transcript_21984/g.27198  ORF Transcript_21984/g.27198 Transcript_21984/m.27198 type:complete len:420 (+) Transcript_21984:58-1317(+)|eukprot:CAMPEP_0172506940 /NCGR_PEP_ID=MMETSP1066-20121228/199794_1 /TAXON_ID=671091 /ORGANISM="Coscinodiscus wailesii, Strain CCMP2513" /LENGTH=419 /DNA_ID=CAMNT_0013284245 /DNA_START=46 /DNA_END=1305 /DNA_ORIENTATION=-
MPPTELATPASVRTWLSTNHPKQYTLLQNFKTVLRVGNLTCTTPGGASGPTNDDARRLVTTRTVELLRNIIGGTKWRTGAQLLVLLRGLGYELHDFREPAIGNVVRRIMCAVREEVMALASMKRGEKGNDLWNVLWTHPQAQVQVKTRYGGGGESRAVTGRSDSFGSSAEMTTSNKDVVYENLPPIFHESRPELRGSIMEVIQEIISELEDLHKTINDQAISHVHAGEVILTYGRSKTVEQFLKAAASKNRQFQVIICESAPHYEGHQMALALSDIPNITPIVIHDAAIFAIMARVNKVLLPARAVLANGGLIAPAGSHMVALAAEENSVPVVVITGMYKLCPMYPHEGQDTLNDLVSPSSVISAEEEFVDVEVINPVHDYIKPGLISLYVTNVGGFQPSYIYRLLAEYYHGDDWESFE